MIALLLLAAGCHSKDPCFGHDGACIGVDLEGQGVSEVDTLQIQVSDGVRVLNGRASAGMRQALPTLTAIYLPNDFGGNVAVAVVGLLADTEVGAGQAQVQVAPGAHADVTVTLRAPTGDGGGLVDTAVAADLAGRDGVVPSSACPSFALFCEDFEHGIDMNKWNLVTAGNNTTLTVDMTNVWSGADSLRAAITSNVNTGGLYYEHQFGQSYGSGKLAARFYVYADMRPQNYVTFAHFTNHLEVVVGENENGTAQGYWKLWDGVGPHFPATPTTMVLNRWQCVEVLFDFAAGHILLYVTDAQQPANLAAPPLIDAAVAPGALTDMDFGVYHTPAGQGLNIFLDDLAVATQRIGCE